MRGYDFRHCVANCDMIVILFADVEGAAYELNRLTGSRCTWPPIPYLWWPENPDRSCGRGATARFGGNRELDHAIPDVRRNSDGDHRLRGRLQDIGGLSADCNGHC